ncbi:capsid cement protein [Variovorax sp. DAIF25]|uniref:capsid cement protein n=1 Tax=Variovorax sp. DAIF25 TaxID=3080983 RepID=UPI003D6ADB14
MTTTYVQPGHVLDFTNNSGAKISSSAVVRIGQLIGVALTDIAIGATGSVAIDGVHRLPKVAGAVIAQGESLVWDASAGAFDDNLAAPAAGDVSGAAAVAFAGAGNGATTLLVRLTGVPGTLAA